MRFHANISGFLPTLKRFLILRDLMWLKTNFPACSSKVEKKKKEAFKGERGQDGALVGVQSQFC